MASKNQAKRKIHSLFQIPGNRENLELLYKSLSQPSKGLCLCQALPEERSKILGFFHSDPLIDRIHMIDMVNPPLGPMELQQNIINTHEKFGADRDIFFIYNIEGSIRLLKTTAEDFFQRMNLIRDFFMQFEAEFVFFVTEPLLKTIIRSAFDFYDWMKFTFAFVPEHKDLSKQSIEPAEKEKIEYSNPIAKINYLKQSIKKVKNEKARSIQLLELGKLYFQVGDYDNALKQLHESLGIEEKHEDFKNMAIRYNEIGLCHEARGKIDKALEFFRKAAKIFEENNDRDNMEQVRANMGRIYQIKENNKSAAGDTKRARTVETHEFRWNELLSGIHRKRVIPVIGHGLYRVEIESKGKSGVLLYDYLAQQVSKECGSTLHPDENHKFAKACLAFLKKTNNTYLQLSDFLKEILKEVRLVPGASLWKLARIKAFDFFITTAYDDFLVATIKTVRDIPTKVHSYSLEAKNLILFKDDLFDCIRDSRCTLVSHIFGNMEETIAPAYTERDIMETLLAFQENMVRQPNNNLSQSLRSSSLLFMGSGFDDWLYRLFIRIISNQPYEAPGQRVTNKYVVDDFSNYKEDPFQEFTRFLRDYDTEVFYTGSVSDFVDLLFDKLEKSYPEEIITPSDFPGTVFLSFEGRDRAAAARLASHLREDGINVWLDEGLIRGGNVFDKAINKAIDNCRVFIPLISKSTIQLVTGDGRLKYHIKEWERAFTKKVSGHDVTIIPVKIDDTAWMYDSFKDYLYLRIPGGKPLGDYKKLKKRLLEIQDQPRQ
jgi:tetratricopeptide (TPR) repeat protein